MRSYSIVLSAARVAVALALAFLIFQIRLDYLESVLYDARMRLRPAPTASGHVETILINPKTIEALKGAPGLADHGLFLERLASVEPKAVVYDMNILSLRGSEEDRARFLQTAAKIPQLIFLTDQLEMKGEEPLRLPSPFESLRLESGPKSSDSSNFAKDSVTRRFLIRYQDQVISDVALARLFRPGLGAS
ncbi:MAG TPA: CHASE2 domain-containing protein, partial [Pseudobdellovibrionaceae bacterium]|nr:CHASE2 domain-containing protein [Pseudobdellovibrionaceae bacterium]